MCSDLTGYFKNKNILFAGVFIASRRGRLLCYG